MPMSEGISSINLQGFNNSRSRSTGNFSLFCLIWQTNWQSLSQNSINSKLYDSNVLVRYWLYLFFPKKAKWSTCDFKWSKKEIILSLWILFSLGETKYSWRFSIQRILRKHGRVIGRDICTVFSPFFTFNYVWFSCYNRYHTSKQQCYLTGMVRDFSKKTFTSGNESLVVENIPNLLMHINFLNIILLVRH